MLANNKFSQSRQSNIINHPIGDLVKAKNISKVESMTIVESNNSVDIHIQYTKFTVEEVEILYSYLEFNDANSKRITLSFKNSSITSAGVQLIANALNNNINIVELCFHNSSIEHTGIEMISAALCNNTTLNSLTITCENVGDACARSFAQILTRNTTLTTLNLNGNDIEEQAIQEIAIALRKNTTLTELYFANFIGNDGKAALISALQNNKYLSIYGIEDDTIKQLNAEHKIFYDEIAKAVKTAACYLSDQPNIMLSITTMTLLDNEKQNIKKLFMATAVYVSSIENSNVLGIIPNIEVLFKKFDYYRNDNFFRLKKIFAAAVPIIGYTQLSDQNTDDQSSDQNSVFAAPKTTMGHLPIEMICHIASYIKFDECCVDLHNSLTKLHTQSYHTTIPPVDIYLAGQVCIGIAE